MTLMYISGVASLAIALALMFATVPVAHAQVAPSKQEISAYTGLHAAAAKGDAAAIAKLKAEGTDLEARDAMGRTAFHVAAFAGKPEVLKALAAAGADMNALEGQAYDAVTIASVANDLVTLKAALEAGNKATNITSPYDGTALIAAAHLGHHEVVNMLIEAGAPLDHINNLGWTAAIEAVVLGDGGADHQKTLRHLIDAGADLTIADRGGRTPLDLARERGYGEMAALIEAAKPRN
jgi:uncharacterized protein